MLYTMLEAALCADEGAISVLFSFPLIHIASLLKSICSHVNETSSGSKNEIGHVGILFILYQWVNEYDSHMY